VKNLLFLIQYILKPRTTGAVLPSSKYLARKMVAGIDFSAARCIVEYGPGTGVFTEEILSARSADTLVILIERNADFCKTLEKRFGGYANLKIINYSAERIGAYLQENGIEHADYIVSGLPFASLPKVASQNILAQTKKHLSPSGKFITFQYTLLTKKFFLGYFGDIEIKYEIRNIPPAFVLALTDLS